MNPLFEHWQIFLSACLFPLVVGFVIIIIRRWFDKRDTHLTTLYERLDEAKEDKIDLRQKVLLDSITLLKTEVKAADNESKIDRITIKNGLKSLEVQFKILNGSLKSAETAIAVQAAKCDERHQKE